MKNEKYFYKLQKHFFSEKENLIFHSGAFKAFIFRYYSDVCAIRLVNSKGEMIILPFKGQQIWSVQFEGQNITMVSPVKIPKQSNDFLENFGCFLLHCGATRVGAPTAKNNHPLHGDLPNAVYAEASLVTGNDEKGNYIGVTGIYHHTVFFSNSYIAHPTIKLYQDATTFNVEMEITNCSETAMELMYVCHINFKPQDYARLFYSACYTPEKVRIRKSIPSHIEVSRDFKKFIDDLALSPEKHHILHPELDFDPEIVFFIDYKADKHGYAHTLLRLTNNYSYYVKHKPEEFPAANRWISRTKNHDAIAIIEPGTCEVEGYEAETKKGNIMTLLPKQKYTGSLTIGLLSPEETEKIISTHNLK